MIRLPLANFRSSSKGKWMYDFNDIPARFRGLFLDGDDAAAGGGTGTSDNAGSAGSDDGAGSGADATDDILTGKAPADDKSGTADDKGDNKGDDKGDDKSTTSRDVIKDVIKPSSADEKGGDAKAPEKYEFALADGKTVKEGENDEIAGFADMARELDLTQDQASKLLPKLGELAAEFEQHAASEQKEKVDGWRKAAREDKDETYPIGGKHFDERVGHANRFIGTFGTDALVTALKESGMVNHPEVIRIFARAGEEIGEDKLVSGSKPGAKNQSLASIFYPSMVNAS